MKLIIQIPCLERGAHAAGHARGPPARGPGLRRGRVAVIDDGSTDRDRRGGARERRRPRRPPDRTTGARGRLPGGHRRRAEARRRRDRQHRRRQPVPRRGHRAAGRADPRGRGRHGGRRPPGRRPSSTSRRCKKAPAATRHVGRARGLEHRRARHDLGLPRLQPRGGDRSCRSSRRSPTRWRRSSRPASCSSPSVARPDRGRTPRRASRGCSRRWGPTCAATRSRSSASTPSTSRCACSGARRC